MNDPFPWQEGGVLPSPSPENPSDSFSLVPILSTAAGFILLASFIVYSGRANSRSSEQQTDGDVAAPSEAVTIPDAILYPPPTYPPPSDSEPEQAVPTRAEPSKPPLFDVSTLTSFEATPAQRATACSICLEPFGTKPLIAGACAHIFHADCVTRWLARDAHSSCPVCRLPFAATAAEVSGRGVGMHTFSLL